MNCLCEVNEFFPGQRWERRENLNKSISEVQMADIEVSGEEPMTQFSNLSLHWLKNISLIKYQSIREYILNFALLR